MQVQESKQQLILAIECAVGRGSLAIVDGGAVVASTDDPDESPSRAEELMIAIDRLVRRSGIALTDIGLIAVSTGPGSYSGIRIGIATALGLKTALNIPCIGIPVLEAMAHSSNDVALCIAAVPVGKKDVAWQSFATAEGKAIATGQPELAFQADFAAAMNDRSDAALLAQSDLGARLREYSLGVTIIRDMGENLADLVGLAVSRGFGGDPQPIYLRNRSHTAVSPGF